MTSSYEPPTPRFSFYPEPRIQNKACSRARQDIFIQYLTLKMYVFSIPPRLEVPMKQIFLLDYLKELLK